MTTAKRAAPVGEGSRGGPSTSLLQSWISVALIPVAFVVAFAVGEGLYALLGYTPEGSPEPRWVALVTSVPAIVVFLIPCAAAVWYGNRARAEGHRAGLLPLAIGAALGLWMLAMNTVSLFAS